MIDCIEVVEVAIMNVLARNGSVCADDMHEVVNFKNLGRDARIIGMALKNLEKEGRIRRAFVKKSARSVCHGRPIIVFVKNKSGFAHARRGSVLGDVKGRLQQSPNVEAFPNPFIKYELQTGGL